MATTRQHATPSQTSESATVIGPGIRISGRVSGGEDLHVEGRIDGAVNLSETLYIAPGGVVAAEVEAHAVVVAGVLVGNVTARDCVTLHAGAKLVGDIHAPRIVIADGAAFRGNIRMGGEVPAPREQPRQAARARPGSATRFGRPAARPAAAPAPARAESPRPRPTEARGEIGRREEPRQHDDDVTVVVRHAALGGEEGERRSRRATPAPEPTRTPEPPRAPPVGAREPAATPKAAPPVAAPAKKKLPPRARIPKPGKRRVHRR